MLHQGGHSLHCTGDRGLPAHFGIEEAVEQPPDFLLLYRLPRRLVAQRIGEIIALRLKGNVLRFVQPLFEGLDHI